MNTISNKKLSVSLISSLIFVLIISLGWADSPDQNVEQNNLNKIVFEKWKKCSNRPGWGEQVELWTINSAGSKLHQLTQGYYDVSPSWSPDGLYIAFCRGREGIFIIRYDGTNLQRITKRYKCSHPQWLRDNRIIFSSPRGSEDEFHKRWRLYKISIETRKEIFIDVGMIAAYSPRVSPDLNCFAFNTLERRGDENIFIADVNGKNVRRLVTPQGQLKGFPVTWYPSGKHLVVLQDTACFKVSIDGLKMERLSGIDEGHISWSPDGKQAVYEYDNAIWIMNADGQNKRLLIKPTDGSIYSNPVW